MTAAKTTLAIAAYATALTAIAYGGLMALGEVLPPALPDYAQGSGFALLAISIAVAMAIFAVARRLSGLISWQSYWVCVGLVGFQIGVAHLLTAF